MVVFDGARCPVSEKLFQVFDARHRFKMVDFKYTYSNVWRGSSARILLLVFLTIVACAAVTRNNCKDGPQCSFMANQGECESNPEYMLITCPKACRNPCVCDVSAFTNDTACDCLVKAQNGYCLTPEGHINCSTTCANVITDPCPLLPLPVDINAVLSTWSTDFQTTVTEICISGYIPLVPMNQGMKICSVGRKWIVDSVYGVSVECSPVDCGPPPSSPNTFSDAPETTYGKTATYICYTNYIPEHGQKTIKCNASGLWEGDPLTCRRVNCGQPPSSPNATYTTTSTTLGGVATYTCSTGFQLVRGGTSLACNLTEIWQGSLIVCEAVDCGPPPSSPNTFSDAPETTYGKTAAYICYTNYIPEHGQKTIKCNATGLWEGDPLTCRIIDCGSPPASPNTINHALATTYGSTATYVCVHGYIPDLGQMTLTCNDSELWEGQPLTCRRVNCGQPPSSPNATYTTTSTTLGGVATYTCSTGFQLVRGGTSLACNLTEIWQGSLIVCEAIECGSPPYIPNTQVQSTGTSYNQSANYSCLPGFEKEQGQNILVCVQSGNWTGDALKCEANHIQTASSDDSSSMDVVIALTLGAAIFLIFSAIIIAWVLKVGTRGNNNKRTKTSRITRDNMKSLLNAQIWDSVNAQFSNENNTRHTPESKITKPDTLSEVPVRIMKAKTPVSLRVTEGNSTLPIRDTQTTSYTSFSPARNTQSTHLNPNTHLSSPNANLASRSTHVPAPNSHILPLSNPTPQSVQKSSSSTTLGSLSHTTTPESLPDVAT